MVCGCRRVYSDRATRGRSAGELKNDEVVRVLALAKTGRGVRRADRRQGPERLPRRRDPHGVSDDGLTTSFPIDTRHYER